MWFWFKVFYFKMLTTWFYIYFKVYAQVYLWKKINLLHLQQLSSLWEQWKYLDTLNLWIGFKKMFLYHLSESSLPSSDFSFLSENIYIDFGSTGDYTCSRLEQEDDTPKKPWPKSTIRNTNVFRLQIGPSVGRRSNLPNNSWVLQQKFMILNIYQINRIDFESHQGRKTKWLH